MPVRDSASRASHSRGKLWGMSRWSAAQLNWRYVHYACCHAPRPPGVEGVYWLSVHCPAYLFTHSAMNRPVRVGKGREEAISLLYCWDFELIFVYSPDFDRLFLWVLLRAAGPLYRQRQPRPVLYGITGQG